MTILSEITDLTIAGIEDSKGCILVVDDDEFSRDLMVRRLGRSGFSVTAAAGGREALAALAARRFDLMILDVVMPGMDGRSVLAQLRQTTPSSELPVIMVTSKSDGEEIAGCFALGATDYVTKPYEFRGLLARIEAHTARQRAEAALKQVHEELERRVERRTQDLRQSNRHLEETRAILTDALEWMTDGFVLWDRDDRLVACNRRFSELFGANAGVVVPGARFADLMRLQAHAGLLRRAAGNPEEWLQARLQRHGTDPRPVEEEFVDGTWLRVSETRTGTGRIVGLTTDITDIKRREIALKTFAETNRRLAAAVNSATSAVLITDPRRSGNPTVFANPAFAAMTGWPVEEALGRDRTFLYGPDTDPRETARIDAAIAEGRPVKVELRLRARSGRSFWVELSASPIRDADGGIASWVIIKSDITARRETEEQLHQAQKMEMIGQLTGGLAHDFNNLLTIILGNLQVVLADGPDAADLRKHVESALDAGRRGSDLTRRMLAFARRQTLAPEILDPSKHLSGFRDFLGRSLGAGVAIECSCDRPTRAIQVDPGQLENAILNLAVNARDAMPDGGTLKIAVENRTLNSAIDGVSGTIPAGAYVRLAVSDTGTGMPADAVSKAIQPFFTTKEAGKGTGLGLSMVYGFVTQSRGHMRIDSALGRGTTVELYFPMAEGAPAETRVVAASAAGGSGETVLLVDDEPQVRAIAAMQLKRLGYSVLQAEDAASAIEIFESHGAVDLLATDLGLPGGTSGVELAAALRARRPDIPILYISGYSDASAVARAEMQKDTVFLSKPYDQAALARATREALDPK